MNSFKQFFLKLFVFSCYIHNPTKNAPLLKKAKNTRPVPFQWNGDLLVQSFSMPLIFFVPIIIIFIIHWWVCYLNIVQLIM